MVVSDLALPTSSAVPPVVCLLSQFVTNEPTWLRYMCINCMWAWQSRCQQPTFGEMQVQEDQCTVRQLVDTLVTLTVLCWQLAGY